MSLPFPRRSIAGLGHPYRVGFRGLGDPTPVEAERKRLYDLSAKTGSPVFRHVGDGAAEIIGSAAGGNGAESLPADLAAKVADIELPSCPPGFVTALIELRAPTLTAPGKYGTVCFDMSTHQSVAPTKKAASVLPLAVAAGAGAGLTFLALKLLAKKKH